MGPRRLPTNRRHTDALDGLDTGIHGRKRSGNWLGDESAGDGCIASARWIARGARAGSITVGADVLAAHALADADVGATDKGRDCGFTDGTEVTHTPAMANRTGNGDIRLHSGFVRQWLGAV